MTNISVCLATYNGNKFLLEQLKSILIQLSADDELIISDDHSTDNTRLIIEGLNDPRIKVVLNTSLKKGSVPNFENALGHCSGRYIFLSDQDDLWLEGKVEKMMSVLSGPIDLVLSDAIVVDENLKTIHASFYTVNNSKSGLINNLRKNSYVGCMMAFNSTLMPLILPFPKHIPAHDIWIGFVAELTCRTARINDKLILYRRHGNNVSSTSEKSAFRLLDRLTFRVNTIRYIPLILFRLFTKRKSVIQ